MKISEVCVSDVMAWAVTDILEDAAIIERIIMPAAKAHISGYTGIPENELDSYPDLTLAYVALCAFLYDNRTMVVINDKENQVVRSFLDSHCQKLVG